MPPRSAAPVAQAALSQAPPPLVASCRHHLEHCGTIEFSPQSPTRPPCRTCRPTHPLAACARLARVNRASWTAAAPSSVSSVFNVVRPMVAAIFLSRRFHTPPRPHCRPPCDTRPRSARARLGCRVWQSRHVTRGTWRHRPPLHRRLHNARSLMGRVVVRIAGGAP